MYVYIYIYIYIYIYYSNHSSIQACHAFWIKYNLQIQVIFWVVKVITGPCMCFIDVARLLCPMVLSERAVYAYNSVLTMLRMPIGKPITLLNLDTLAIK